MNEAVYKFKILSTFADLIRALLRDITKYIWFQIVFFILSVIVLTPFSAMVFTFLINSTGQPSITNEYVISFIFSLRGAVTLSLWIIITFFLIFTEHAGIIFICYNARFREKTGIVKTMAFVLRRIPVIMVLGANLFFRFALFSLPFLAIWGITYFTLLTDYDINYYYVRRPPAFWVSIVIGGLSLAGYLILVLKYLTRWIFILHLVLLEQEQVGNVFRRSGELVAGVGMQILKVLFFWGVCIWAFITITTAGYGVINELILGIIGSSPEIAIPVMAFLYISGFILNTVLVLLVSPVFSILLTQLYYRVLCAKGLVVVREVGNGESEIFGENCSYFRFFQKVAFRAVIIMSFLSMITLGVFLAEGLHKLDEVEITAHRGSSTKAPENSLSAIKQAIADQADYAEIDVQETIDGVIVVLHDSDLMRITGKKLNIWETAYAQVEALDAGNWFSPEFAGEKIPTLEEAIEVARNKIKLNIELKFNGHGQQLTERVVAIIRRHDFEDQCVITSMNYQELLKAKALDNRLRVGLIIFDAIGKAFDLETDFFSIATKMASETFISKAQNRGKGVHVWIVNTPDLMEHFIYRGVNNIITDYPTKLVDILKRRAEMNGIERLKDNFMKWLKR